MFSCSPAIVPMHEISTNIMLTFVFRLGTGLTIVNFANVTADLDENDHTKITHRFIFSNKIYICFIFYVLLMLLWFFKWKKKKFWFEKQNVVNCQ